MIEVVGQRPKPRYTATCPNQECRSILEYDSEDIAIYNVRPPSPPGFSYVTCPRCTGKVNADGYFQVEKKSD